MDFAIKYGADKGFVSPKNESGVEPLTFAQDYVKTIQKEVGLEAGFDVAVEASGAEACTHMAICLLKNGGTCKTPAKLHDRKKLRQSRYSSWPRQAVDFSPVVPPHSERAQYQG